VISRRYCPLLCFGAELGDELWLEEMWTLAAFHTDPLGHVVLHNAEQDREHNTVDELGLVLTGQ
jgi:hypothetical protein